MLIRSTFHSRLQYMSSATSKTGADIAHVNAQISTGKRILNLSDEPWATSELHQLRRGIQDQRHYEDSCHRAMSLMTTMEYSITGAMNLVDRAKTLAIQLGNDTYSIDQRQAAAEEVLLMKDRLVALANTEFNGRYIFSGQAYNSQPYDASFAYVGSTSDSIIDLSRTGSVEVGYDGSDVFQGAFDVFQSLDDFVTALNADDGESIRGLITEFDAVFDQLDVYRTKIGTNTRRALDMIELTESLQIELQTRLSSVEEVDLTEAITRFSLLQTQYDINLQLTTKTRTVSLFSRM